jgi:hypothetical protein
VSTFCVPQGHFDHRPAFLGQSDELARQRDTFSAQQFAYSVGCLNPVADFVIAKGTWEQGM